MDQLLAPSFTPSSPFYIGADGSRSRLKYTRAILDAIHSGELARADYETYETFNLHVPTSATGVPPELLNPKKSWVAGEADFKEEVTKLAKLFEDNFKKYADEATPDVVAAGTVTHLPLSAPMLAYLVSRSHRVR